MERRPTSYLGLTIKGDEETRSMELSQVTYARGLLEKFWNMESRPTSEPTEVGLTITREKLLSMELTTYFRAATGCLLYLSRCARSDMPFCDGTNALYVLTW